MKDNLITILMCHSDFVSALVVFGDFSNLQQWLFVSALPRNLPAAISQSKFVQRACHILYADVKCDVRNEKEVVFCLVQ